jgi:hypothetical protein
MNDSIILLISMVVILATMHLFMNTLERDERRRRFVRNLKAGDRVRFKRRHWIPTGLEVTSIIKGTVVCPPTGNNPASVRDDRNQLHYVPAENILLP